MADVGKSHDIVVSTIEQWGGRMLDVILVRFNANLSKLGDRSVERRGAEIFGKKLFPLTPSLAMLIRCIESWKNFRMRVLRENKGVYRLFGEGTASFFDLPTNTSIDWYR